MDHVTWKPMKNWARKWCIFGSRRYWKSTFWNVQKGRCMSAGDLKKGHILEGHLTAGEYFERSSDCRWIFWKVSDRGWIFLPVFWSQLYWNPSMQGQCSCFKACFILHFLSALIFGQKAQFHSEWIQSIRFWRESMVNRAQASAIIDKTTPTPTGSSAPSCHQPSPSRIILPP